MNDNIQSDDRRSQTMKCHHIQANQLNGIVIIDLSFNYLTNINPIINILPTTTTTMTLNDTPRTFTLQLEQLSLWHNEIEIEQIYKLAQTLEINKTLRKLNLSENNIGNDGAIAFAKSLENNQTLETLEIFGNNISTLGAIKLCDLLEKYNASIIVLDLRFNLITCKFKNI